MIVSRSTHAAWLEKRREKLLLLAVFLLALTLRLIYLYQIRANPLFDCPMGDPWYHDQWAREIAGGEWVGSQVFFRAPLYPYFLGLIYRIFGQSYIAPRIIQFLLGSLSPIILYLLAAKLFHKKIALMASVIAAAYGMFIYFEGELLIPVLLVPLDLALIWLLLRAEEKPSHARWLLAGAILGLSALARPNILVFIPFVLFWAYLKLRERRRVLLFGLSFLAGLGLTVFPVTLRNYVVGRDFVLIAYQGGVNFYLGNNPEADGKTALMPKGEDPKEQVALWEKDLGRDIKPSLESRLWYLKGLRFARENPGTYLKLLLKKCVLFWNGYEIRNNQDIYFVRRYSPLFSLLVWRADNLPPFGLSFPFGIVGPLALTGLLLSLREWRRLLLVWLFIASYSISIVLFFVCARYRIPILPFLMMFAAFTLSWWYERLKARRLRDFALSLLVFLGFYALVNHNFYRVKDENYAFAHYYLGNAHHREGDYKQALAEFERALAIDPAYPSAHLDLGATHFALGNLDKAEEEFRMELNLNPAQGNACNYIGLVKQREGRYDEAARWFEKALQMKTIFPEAHLNLAMAYDRMGREEEALRELREAVKLEPGLAAAHNLLGVLHLKHGSLAPAIASLEAAVRCEADNPIYHYNLGLAYAGTRRLDLASSHFERALELDPLFTDAHANLGNAYLGMGRLDEAMVSLKEALAINPRLAETHFNLGLAYMRKGLPDSARIEFNRAIELEPLLQRNLERFE